MAGKCKLCTAEPDIREQIESYIREGNSAKDAEQLAKSLGMNVAHTSISRHWQNHVLQQAGETDNEQQAIVKASILPDVSTVLEELKQDDFIGGLPLVEIYNLAARAQARSILLKNLDVYNRITSGDYVSAREIKATQDLSPAICQLSENLLSKSD